MIKRLMATSNNGGEYQNWQFVKTRSQIAKHNLQLQTNNRFLPLEETLEVWNKVENCNQEEIYPNNNIPRGQKEKHQCPKQWKSGMN